MKAATQTFVNIPHDGRVVYGAGHHEVSISRPADVVHVSYVSPKRQIQR